MAGCWRIKTTPGVTTGCMHMSTPDYHPLTLVLNQLRQYQHQYENHHKSPGKIIIFPGHFPWSQVTWQSPRSDLERLAASVPKPMNWPVFFDVFGWRNGRKLWKGTEKQWKHGRTLWGKHGKTMEKVLNNYGQATENMRERWKNAGTW